MSDVQSAAERLRRVQQGETLKAVYSNPHWAAATNYQLAHECDMAEVALAYLAEHPADSELPIDEEWLRSVGFEAFDEHGSGWFKDSPGGSTRVSIGYRGQWLVNGNEMEYAAQPKTRGDLRRLCFALGVELKSALTP